MLTSLSLWLTRISKIHYKSDIYNNSFLVLFTSKEGWKANLLRTHSENESVRNFAEQIRKIYANLTSFHICTSFCLHAFLLGFLFFSFLHFFLSSCLPTWLSVYTFLSTVQVCLSIKMRMLVSVSAWVYDSSCVLFLPWRKMEQPYSPNLSDLAECVILCPSWLQSPGKVSWICDLRTTLWAILGWLFSAVQASVAQY
jgi:hypothetical protein